MKTSWERLISAKKTFVCCLLVILSLGGCALGPNYHRPNALVSQPMPATFGDPALTNAGEWKMATPAAHLPRGAWWELYGDSELNRIESLAATHNQQIAAALANFAQARALIKEARAAFFPQINVAPSLTRQRTSANTSPSSAAAGSSRTFNLYNVSADASWEVDLWGRIRREVEGANARLLASADDLESVKLALHAEVASDYFALCSLETQAELFRQAAIDYSRALDLTQNRRKSGVASELDVSQAETQLKSAQAQIPGIELQSAQLRHALAVLCGEPATTFSLAPHTAASISLPAIPVPVPTEWLESRPDVASSERMMAAANADVGVAKTAFFPRLLLSGSGGFESIDASTLFNWPSHLWAVGPSLQLPLFTGGRNRSQFAAARAVYDRQVADYRQNVLTAFQEVEDQLAAQTLLKNQLAREEDALNSARRTLEISMNRYKSGVEPYLNVIAAEAIVLTHDQAVVQLRGQRLGASTALIKALGGGWDHPSNTDTAPSLSESLVR